VYFQNRNKYNTLTVKSEEGKYALQEPKTLCDNEKIKSLQCRYEKEKMTP